MIEFQHRPGQGNLQSSRRRIIADRLIGHAKRQIIHRPRWRHADMPEAKPTWMILDRGLGSRRPNLERARPIGKLPETGRRHAAGAKYWITDDLAQIEKIGLDAINPRLLKRQRQF